jgi:hypothetical protein
MNVFEILIGLFLWPIQTIFELMTSTIGLSIILVLFVIFALIITTAPTTEKTDSTAQKEDEPTGLSLGAYTLIGWGVYSLLTSSSKSKSKCDIDQEAEAEVKTKGEAERSLSVDKSKSKSQSKRSKKQAKPVEQVHMNQPSEPSEPQPTALPEQEVELTLTPETQPELNFGGLGSLLAKEMVRTKDDESERLTVKKGIEALGGVDVIDAFLSKKDKS